MKSMLLRIILISFLIVFFIPNATSAEMKTFIKEYSYQASEDDSRNSCRTISLREVKRLLLEELGTYLESVTKIQNFQLTKDQIVTLTAGIVQTEIIDEKWDGRNYFLRARIVADSGDVIKNIDVLRSDRGKTKELEDLRERSEKQLREIKSLKKELTMTKGEDLAKGKIAYDNKIKNISAVEWIEKGLAYNRSKDFSNAIKAYTKAIELNPNDAFAYAFRAAEYGLLGNHRQAIDDFNKLIELNPNDAHAYSIRGAAYGFLGNHRQAIENYDKAIEINPNNAGVYFDRGYSYGELGNYMQEIYNYSKALVLNPNDAKIFLNRGVANGKLGNYRQAIDDFDMAIELNQKYADAYFNRGIAYSKLRNFDQFFEDIKTAARMGNRQAQDAVETLRRKGTY